MYRTRAIFLLPNHRPCGMMVPSGEAALLQGAQPCTAQQKSLDRGSLFAPLTPKGPLRRKADGIEKQPGKSFPAFLPCLRARLFCCTHPPEKGRKHFWKRASPSLALW